MESRSFAIFPRVGEHPVRAGCLAAFALLATAALVVSLAAPKAEAGGVLRVLAVLAAVPPAFWGLRWLWRKLTYRVGVRLLISYVLIGLTPLALAACLALGVGYVLVGQYGTVTVRHRFAAENERLARAAADALATLGREGPEAAASRLASAAADQRFAPEWILAAGARTLQSAGAGELPVPGWAPQGDWSGFVTLDDRTFDAVIRREGDRIAALVVPLNLARARAFGEGQWYEVRWIPTKSRAASADIEVGVPEDKLSVATTIRVDGHPVSSDQVEPDWPSRRPQSGTYWQRMQNLWLWETETPRSWQDGTEERGRRLVVLIKVTVLGAVDSFFGSPKNLRSEVSTGFRVIGIVFGAIYAIAVGFAAVMILRVTRATARLTRGARAVARGDLEQRVPVKRRDQLGDLAVSFNSMTESVRTMLVQVAEKERMAREMELAREIQESLLPPSELSSGPLSVWAHFRPATEVGGDYFDLFVLSEDRLLAAVGDVAGHGLHTGLLMAMVKSAVATLVQEGHTGRALLERLNRLLLAQPIRHRMVSLALAEIDASRGTVAVTSAGHPPGMLLASEGDVEELLLSSLPLGHRWPEPPPSRTRQFAPGSRLLLYSDGLVEARNSAGQPFGYDSLREVLRSHRETPAASLIAVVLGALDRHLAGQPMTDDLTVLVVESLRRP